MTHWNDIKGLASIAALAGGLAVAGVVAASAADLADAPLKSTSVSDPAAVIKDNPWFARVGLGGFIFDSSATVTVNGATVPGGTARATNNLTAVVELGYFVTRNISVQFTGGIPPTSTLRGSGTLAGAGRLGQVTYGPAALTTNFVYKDFGAFQPYVGLGGAYAIIFGQSDGAVQNLKVKGAAAFVVQGGADYYLNKNWSIFADVKHLFLTVNATGTVGGAPATAKTRLDPTIVTAGIAYHW